jgi:hypothetical protein
MLNIMAVVISTLLNSYMASIRVTLLPRSNSCPDVQATIPFVVDVLLFIRYRGQLAPGYYLPLLSSWGVFVLRVPRSSRCSVGFIHSLFPNASLEALRPTWFLVLFFLAKFTYAVLVLDGE